MTIRVSEPRKDLTTMQELKAALTVLSKHVDKSKMTTEEKGAVNKVLAK